MLLVNENTDEREELLGLCAVSSGQLGAVFEDREEHPIHFPSNSNAARSALSRSRDRSKLTLYVSKGRMDQLVF